MTDPVTSGSGTTATTYSPITKTAPSGTPKQVSREIDKDLFLKLLVAQLKYQDPNKPVDSQEFVGQTAQFTMVDKLTSLETSQQKLLASQSLLGASQLVGRTVTYLDEGGETTHTGIVASASVSGSDPTLRVGNKDVPLSSVTEVRATTS